MADQRAVVVLVDTYETADHGVPQTARHLAPAFLAAGAECVRVQSAPEPPGVYRTSTPTWEHYRDNVVHDGDLGRTVAALEPYRPVAVVPGGEYGVAFADVLGEALGVPHNGTASRAARRDKHAMVEAVRAAGLRAARQIRTGDRDELAAWHRATGGRVVVKPVRSAGGDGVSFCDTPEQSAAALDAITARQNVFSEANDVVVAQEYLVGAEFIVNTVSRDGAHHVCDLWRSRRFSVNGITDLSGACYLVPRRGPRHDEVVDYAFAVLDAVGIRHGAAHAELKLGPDGPCLIEVGARVSGGDLPHYARLATGDSQLDWVVDAALRPDRFHARRGEDYEVRRHFSWAALISPVEGTLRRYTAIDRVRALESFHELWELTRPGDRLRRTVDDTTYPVIVTFMHEVDEIVQRDLGTLRYLDGVGFYELA
ncbi:ATP-grasp domain-containing protein [Saccharothrix hoggarensis]|uniref:ATP-grasp domain-containing protein n=1 Tax=Saccharothrix hoggarensis TaxID=913853 RepID=A0ABW3QYD8_9PSEU